MSTQETIHQLGGSGLSGAFAYTGTTKFGVHGDTAVMQVNGKPGYKSFITITIEPNDTYTVKYVALRGITRTQLAEQKLIYCDQLQEVVEHMYDDVITATNGGFIPLGSVA